MKKTFVVFALTSLMMSASYASHKQNVQVCVDVAGNDTPYTFRAEFESTDIFDRGKGTAYSGNGQVCRKHQYQHGPKNLKLTLKANKENDVKIVPDLDSCAYLNSPKPGKVNSNYQRVTANNEVWNFSLVKTSARGGFENVFNLVCSHRSV